MDNARLDVTNKGKDNLLKALSLSTDHSKVVGYVLDDDYGMILCWTSINGMVEFPYEMTLSQACDFVWGWLSKECDKMPPDQDVDTGHAWRVFNESWGHINRNYQCFAAVQPMQAYYGK